MIMAFNTIAKIVILVSIFLVVAINVISAANAYNFVRCEGDTNTYPEGTNCESDSQIIKEESEDYQEYKEKTKWWDEEEEKDEKEHEEESEEWNKDDEQEEKAMEEAR